MPFALQLVKPWKMSAAVKQIIGHVSESDNWTRLTNQPQYKSHSVGLSYVLSEEEDFQVQK